MPDSFIPFARLIRKNHSHVFVRHGQIAALGDESQWELRKLKRPVSQCFSLGNLNRDYDEIVHLPA